MGHPPEMLSRCAAIIQEHYPDNDFDYLIEQRYPGTRMSPDVMVQSNGKVLCVAEIGYTRASKIARYRELGVPDIRWYSKEMELVLWEQAKDGKVPTYQTTRETVVKHIATEQKRWERVVRAKAGDPPFLVFDEVECGACRALIDQGKLDIGDIDPEECLQFVYFDYKSYRLIRECENYGTEHDFEERGMWKEWMQAEYLFGDKEDYFRRYYEDVLLLQALGGEDGGD